VNNNKVLEIPLSQIHAGDNDRKKFDKKELQALADSIKKQGLIQPITLNLFAPDPQCVFGGDPLGDGAQFTIVAGERRFRACQIAGLETIRALVVQLTEEEASAVMLAENTSRVDLDPIDEARAYQIRIDKFGWSIEKCAETSGVTKIRVQFRLKLLSLRSDLQDLIRTGNLQIGYAQILADADLDPNRQTFAIKALLANPRPVPGWFRKIVNDYREQQLQADLFDTSNFLVCQEMPIETDVKEPPHPSTATLQIKGSTPKETALAQSRFWAQAGEAWREIGKTFKAQECEAASSSLESLSYSL
jgi:ParB/RepB/Spo0J family partition protein